MILSVSKLTKSYDGTDILRDVSFHIEEHDKLAVTGPNGSGKTTLLKQIVGEESPDAGTVVISSGKTFGYLPQNASVDSQNSIYDELISEKQYILDCEKELNDIREKISLGDGDIEKLNERFAELSEKYEALDGYSLQSRVTGILKGLGFSENEYDKKVSLLSGGQKTRLALSKLLLSSPDIIILDEPTNHLDIDAVTWLESYLKNWKGTVIIVSHDRYFLDHVVNKVLDIENGTARLYTGNYSVSLEKKTALRKDMMKAWLNNQTAIRHQQEVIDKLKQFNREKSIKRAESREKLLAKMERTEKPFDVDDAMKLHFKPARESGKDVLFADGLTKSFDGKNLLNRVSLDVKRGEKIAVIGPNGTGKTTLLKIINTAAVNEGIASPESLEIAERTADPDSGVIEFGAKVEIAYYDQEHQVLSADNTVFDEISDAYPMMNNTEIRNLLAAFLFTGDDVFKEIRDLSGGEKGRLSLAKLMLSKANLLLLDEPTNHLDINSKEILEEAVRNYEGTCICVSHDRYFINSTCTRILELNDRKLINYYGNYDYYLQKKSDPSFDPSRSVSGLYSSEHAGEEEAMVRKSSSNSEAEALKAEIVSEKERLSKSYAEQKSEKQALQKLKSMLQAVEKDIERTEREISENEELLTHPEISTDHIKLAELSEVLEKADTDLSELYEKWEELSEKIDNFYS